MPGFKGRKPEGGSKAFGQASRGKGPTPPKRRKGADLPPLNPIERTHELLEDRRIIQQDWEHTGRRFRRY